jgi:hypothetical protein
MAGRCAAGDAGKKKGRRRRGHRQVGPSSQRKREGERGLGEELGLRELG